MWEKLSSVFRDAAADIFTLVPIFPGLSWPICVGSWFTSLGPQYCHLCHPVGPTPQLRSGAGRGLECRSQARTGESSQSSLAWLHLQSLRMCDWADDTRLPRGRVMVFLPPTEKRQSLIQPNHPLLRTPV